MNETQDILNKHEQILRDYGVCHEYTPTHSCVTGENMVQFNKITLEDCQYVCSHTSGCFGVEYFKQSNAYNREYAYDEGDCNLSSSLDTQGCDPD